jgi:hypothetical protein
VKALIIILVLVGVSFLALIIYGQRRHDAPANGCPPFTRDSDGKYHVPDGWCPPEVAKTVTHATRGLQARFTAGLGIDPVEINTSPTLRQSFLVPASKKKARGAKLTLVKGDWVVAEVDHDDGPDRVCLCRPGSVMTSQWLLSGCGKAWDKDHQAPKASPPGVCQPHDDHGMLPFEKEGGSLVLVPGAPATVRVE